MVTFFTLSVASPAPADVVWDRLWDTEAHTDAIPLTQVTGSFADGRVLARTAVGPWGFDDPMVVTRYEPPIVPAPIVPAPTVSAPSAMPGAGHATPGRCALRKTGRVVRGAIDVDIEPLRSGGTRVHWRQQIGIAGVPRLLNPMVGLVAKVAYGAAVRRILAR